MSPTRIAIVGAGISGLATAYRLREGARERGRDLALTILEAGPQPGGTVGTSSDGGFRVESGPNGFLDAKPETLRLCRDLGLDDELLRSSDAARRRFLLRGDRLEELPTSPPAFLRSPVLSRRGRLRVLAEPWIRPRPPDGAEETVADFGRRRLGAEAVDGLLDPMVSGVYAGDPARLSLDACFPRIAELERDHGSLIRAQIALRRERRAAGEAAGGPSGPGGTLTSLAPGLVSLVDALARTLGEGIHTGTEVRSVEAGPGGSHRVRVEGGEDLEADLVVLACPAHAAARILALRSPDPASALEAIAYAPAAVIGLGFDREAVRHPLEGFGFLVPGRENRKILGTLWTSSIYPGHRAPEGAVLLRSIVGGARRPEMMELDDAELVAAVRGELRSILGIDADPVHTRVVRWPRAIPQYEIGHRERVARAEGALPGGIRLTGNAYRGVALNDCTREAERIAAEILDAADDR